MKLQTLINQNTTEPSTILFKGNGHFQLSLDVLTCNDHNQKEVEFAIYEESETHWHVAAISDLSFLTGYEYKTFLKTKALSLKPTNLKRIELYSSSVFTLKQNALELYWVETFANSTFEVWSKDTVLNDYLVFFCNNSSNVIYFGKAKEVNINCFCDSSFYMNTSIEICYCKITDKADVFISKVTGDCNLIATKRSVFGLILGIHCKLTCTFTKNVRRNIKRCA